MILGDDNNDDDADDEEDIDDDFDEKDAIDKDRYYVQREEPPYPELLDKQSIFGITIMQKPCLCEYVTLLCWKDIFDFVDMCHNCDQIMVNI